ncbi:MAG: heme exporter protein CcmD [Pseudomonadota bacterium]
MSFDSIGEFMTMGGHGFYVWLAYGATLLVLAANVLSLSFARRRYLRDAQALAKRQGGTEPAACDPIADPENSRGLG